MAKKNRVTMEKALVKLFDFYERGKKDKFVRKPISFALHRAWRWADAHEVAKTEEDRS